MQRQLKKVSILNRRLFVLGPTWKESLGYLDRFISLSYVNASPGSTISYCLWLSIN